MGYCINIFVGQNIRDQTIGVSADEIGWLRIVLFFSSSLPFPLALHIPLKARWPVRNLFTIHEQRPRSANYSIILSLLFSSSYLHNIIPRNMQYSKNDIVSLTIVLEDYSLVSWIFQFLVSKLCVPYAEATDLLFFKNVHFLCREDDGLRGISSFCDHVKVRWRAFSMSQNAREYIYTNKKKRAWTGSLQLPAMELSLNHTIPNVVPSIFLLADKSCNSDAKFIPCVYFTKYII